MGKIYEEGENYLKTPGYKYAYRIMTWLYHKHLNNDKIRNTAKSRILNVRYFVQGSLNIFFFLFYFKLWLSSSIKLFIKIYEYIYVRMQGA